MIKLKRIHLYYYESREEYSMDVTIGDSNREVTFKMDDKQTKKAIIPVLDALCEACALSASELKQDVLASINSSEVAE